MYGDNTFRTIVEIRFIRVYVECILSYCVVMRIIKYALILQLG